MSAGRHAKSLVVAVLLAISASVPTSRGAQANEKPISAAGAKVFVYGSESAIVDAATKKTHSEDRRKYPNELDHVFMVLLARACPTPEAASLARGTVDALCEEVESLGHAKIADSQRSAWAATAARSKTFEPVLKNLEAAAAGRAKRERLVNAGLTAMLRATGCRAARVLSNREAESIANMMEARVTPSKERGWLGVDVSRWPTIRVVPDMPAAKAGLRNGDMVLRVNARDVARTESAADGLKALRGPAGTAISLTVKRGGETLAFQVRKASAAERIRARVIDRSVVYIQVPRFEGSGIAKRVKELVRKYVTDATSGVVLDLRNNPGGRPEEANGVADIFLDAKLLQIYEFSGGRRIAFKSKPGALGVRVIVLTNRATGCGAETLVIALHDNHRATVIGQPTAGVLFGHDFEKLRDGRMIEFRSEPTVLSPTGHDYSETGFPPDILVDPSKGPGEDNVLSRAIQLMRAHPPKHDSEGRPP